MLRLAAIEQAYVIDGCLHGGSALGNGELVLGNSFSSAPLLVTRFGVVQFGWAVVPVGIISGNNQSDQEESDILGREKDDSSDQTLGEQTIHTPRQNLHWADASSAGCAELCAGETAGHGLSDAGRHARARDALGEAGCDASQKHHSVLASYLPRGDVVMILII